MAVTLHTLLQSALDSETRNPVVTAYSESADSEIPFNGQRLHNTGESERFPGGLLHSTGRYFTVYSRTASDRGDLYIDFSDTGRASWNGPIKLTTAGAFEEYLFPTIVELGNTAKDIGIVFMFRTASAAQHLKFMVVSTAGAVVTAVTTIDATGGSIFWYEPGVIKWSDDSTYTMICPRFNGTTWDLYRFTHAATAGVASWSAWTNTGAMTFSGGDAVTGEKRRPFIYAPTVAGVPQHWLMFDRVDSTSGTQTRKNCYYAKNSAKLVGTLATTRFTTSTTNLGTSYIDPSMAQPSSYAANTMAVAYTKTNQSVLLNTSSTPALSANSANFIHYDEAADLIIMADRGSAGSSGSANGVMVFNASDLSLYRHYYRTNVTTGGTPPTGQFLQNTSAIVQFYYTYPIVVVAYTNTISVVNPASTFDIIDIQANTVTSVYRSAVAESSVPLGNYRMTLDVGTPNSIAFEGTKIYMVNQDRGAGTSNARIWSIDYGVSSGVVSIEPRHIGYAVPTAIDTATDRLNSAGQRGTHWDLANKVLYFGQLHDYSGTPPTVDSDYGRITKIDLNSGALMDTWSRTTTANFPRAGVTRLAKVGDRIYFSAAEDAQTAGDVRGLCWVPDPDTAHNAPVSTGVAPFDEPEFSISSNVQLHSIRPVGDGRVMIATNTNGLGIWDGTSAPIIYNQTTVGGMPTTGGNPNPMTDVAFDGSRNRFYCALYAWSTPITNGGILIFDIDGDLLQPYYSVFSSMNTTPVTPANAGSESILVTTNEDDNVHLMVNGLGTGLAAFWARRVGSASPTTLWASNTTQGLSEFDLMFDEALGQFDLTPYLTGETSVIQSIEHQPNRIEFNVARGELFDPTNSKSIFRSFLDQGRRVVFKKGEVCSDGATRTVDLFTGYIESGSVDYQDGVHPIRSVVAFDLRKPAFDYEIRLSAAYGFGGDDDPLGRPDGDGPVATAGIISHLAQTLAGFEEAEILVGTFANSASVKLQLVNMSPADMMQVVANRFQRVIYVDNSGILVTKYIEENPTVTSSLDMLTNKNNLITMNPNESEGESTNRVTVRGVSDEELTVTYPYENFGIVEAAIQSSSVPLTVYRYFTYSDDFSVEAINPSTLGTITIPQASPVYRIIYADTITAEIVRALGFSNFPVAANLGVVTDEAIAAFLTTRGVLITFQVYPTDIPTTTTFYISINAQRIGTIRQEIQASANDLIAQRRLRGNVIERIVDFPAADTVSICQIMADWFLLRVKLTRRIVQYSMLGHLRQEPGDVIEFTHPESNEPVKAIVFQVGRRFSVGGADTQNLMLGVYE